MNYWLFKSEPASWSWEEQKKTGRKGEGWDGVRNYEENESRRLRVFLSFSH